MHLSQVYETTIMHPDEQLSLRVLVIPASSLRRIPPQRFLNHLHDFGLEVIGEITPQIFPFTLQTAVASLVNPDVTGEAFLQAYSEGEQLNLCLNSAALAFAGEVIIRRILPFEGPPPGAESIANVAITAADSAEPGFVGLIRAENIPLILITHPNGILIAGSAVNIDVVVKMGIWERILRWLE